MPFRASHCPGVCNANTRAKWSLWCGCRGNVLNILSYGDQGHEAMEIPQCLSVNLVSIKLTVRPWHSLRVLLLERGNSQNQNKAKSPWGFGTHFSYPLSEKVWLKTSDILPVGKDVYFWLYIFFFLEVFLLGRIPFQKLSQAFKIPHKVLFVKNCLAPTKLITSLCHHKEFQHFSFHHVKPWSTGIWTGQVEWRNVYAPTQYKSAGWWRQDTLILGTVSLLVAK